MQRIGHLCYRMMVSNGAGSPASFFRTVEMFKGTLFIDEADLQDGGDMSNAIVKFINLGAMKGNPIWRQEEVMGPDGAKRFETVANSTYCPKLIAMRKEFRDDAVASRSLTLRLQPREPVELKAKGIRLSIDTEFRRRARAVRNLLLRWRLQMWEPEIIVDDDLMDIEISSRLNQVTMGLKAIAKDDPELMEEIKRFLKAYNQEMVLDRSMTVAARVVEALWKIYRYPDLRKKYVNRTNEGDEYIMVGDVRTIANEIMDEMNQVDDSDDDDQKKKKRGRDEISAKGCGTIIRQTLQLQIGQRRGTGFPVMWDEMKMQGLAKRYGVEIKELPEVKPELEHAAVVHHPTPPEPIQETMPFDVTDLDAPAWPGDAGEE
jgi:hypothetical protein